MGREPLRSHQLKRIKYLVGKPPMMRDAQNVRKQSRIMLEKIYGKIEANYKFGIGTYPEDFGNTMVYDKLEEIHKALQNLRGFKEFIKAKTLPNCDFFVSNLGFIVEFDESQHFTLPRKIALELYPENSNCGLIEKDGWNYAKNQCQR